MPTAKKIMNIFTEAKKEVKPQTDTYKQILDSILLTGTATSDARVIVSTDAAQILDFSTGQPRLKRSLSPRFSLIMSPPISDKIQCCLCKKVIFDFDYPIWYHSVRFAKNMFHYFICFDSSSPDKPSCKCYRRSAQVE